MLTHTFKAIIYKFSSIKTSKRDSSKKFMMMVVRRPNENSMGEKLGPDDFYCIYVLENKFDSVFGIEKEERVDVNVIIKGTYEEGPNGEKSNIGFILNKITRNQQ